MHRLIPLYRLLMSLSRPLLRGLLHIRTNKGKEIQTRLSERMGIAGRPRPQGPLVWIHAASVGESQSALILIHRLLAFAPYLHILVTTGTRSSAQLMEQRLPAPRAFHQFIPLDCPAWTKAFLDHWHPDLALWMESELWPNLLNDVGRRAIPAFLVNARLSKKSFNRWKILKNDIALLLNNFTLILAQTEKDADRFVSLGANKVAVINNLKYSAAPLTVNDMHLNTLKAIITSRPVWVYASTHADEESIAMRIHKNLKQTYPTLLTIIVPRHPERRDDIKMAAQNSGLTFTLRGDTLNLPRPDDDLYIADTMGELGLFYALSPIAMIGRSLSRDGGGGHNPIEAAQLGCAVLSGPLIQFQKELFDDMVAAGAARIINNESDLLLALRTYLENEAELNRAQIRAQEFIKSRSGVIDGVMGHLSPVIQPMGKDQNAA